LAASIKNLPIFTSDACRRCLRRHPKLPCKSLDKACRRCGVVGHFAEVHDIKDPTWQQAIIEALGLPDLYKEKVMGDGLKRPTMGPEDAIQRKLLKLANHDQNREKTFGRGLVGPPPAPQAEPEVFDTWYQ